MDILEQIGAFAGLAAVLGLAVLSALYFSQARDVKRLREWAGRAPERVAEGATADQLARGVVAQPQPKVVQEVQAGAPPVPGAKPAAPAVPAATPAAAGAGAATAGQKPGAPKPATPAATPAAAQAASAKPGGPAPVPATAAAGAAAAVGAPAAPARPGDGAKPGSADDGDSGSGGDTAETPATTAAPPSPPGAPAQGAGAKPAGPVTPAARPASPAAPGARPPVQPARPTVPLPSQSGRAPSPSQTAILPPRQGDQRWYRRLLASPRYLVLAIAGVLIVGGAAAFGVVQLTGDDDGGGGGAGVESPGSGGGATPSGGEDGKPKAPPVNAADVTVSVLNGTLVSGLAAQIGDEVERFGFVLGNVDNSADQGARNESVVLFAPGAEREAIAVARKLKIAQREPIDPESQGIAGDASVVVITGTDLTP